MRGTLSTITTFAIVLLLAITISCTKEKNQELFFWNQTQCAEPWETLLSDSESKIKSAIINYLSDEDIKVDNVEFEFDENFEHFCQACSCTTGTKIIVTIPEGNSVKMEGLGFEKND